MLNRERVTVTSDPSQPIAEGQGCSAGSSSGIATRPVTAYFAVSRMRTSPPWSKVSLPGLALVPYRLT